MGERDWDTGRHGFGEMKAGWQSMPTTAPSDIQKPQSSQGKPGRAQCLEGSTGSSRQATERDKAAGQLGELADSGEGLQLVLSRAAIRD